MLKIILMVLSLLLIYVMIKKRAYKSIVVALLGLIYAVILSLKYYPPLLDFPGITSFCQNFFLIIFCIAAFYNTETCRMGK